MSKLIEICRGHYAFYRLGELRMTNRTSDEYVYTLHQNACNSQSNLLSVL